MTGLNQQVNKFVSSCLFSVMCSCWRLQMIFCSASRANTHSLISVNTRGYDLLKCDHFENNMHFVQYLFFVHSSSADFCQLHLNLNTAHRNLKLSEDDRKISFSFKVQQYPDHPERFDQFNYIMCREGLFSHCYWEDECRGEDWAVAVCYKRIGRKGDSDSPTQSPDHIHWTTLPCFLY